VALARGVGIVLESQARCLLACRNGTVAATRPTAPNTSAVRGQETLLTHRLRKALTRSWL